MAPSHLRRFAALFLASAALAMLGSPAGAADPYEIDAILPLTGGLAFVGTTNLQALKALEAYVNRVPMGGNLYGVEAAARTYFGGGPGNGFLLSNPKTSGDPWSRRTMKLVNHGDALKSDNAANHIWARVRSQPKSL